MGSGEIHVAIVGTGETYDTPDACLDAVKPAYDDAVAACETVRDLRIVVESDLRNRGVEVTGIRIFGNLTNEP